MAKLRLILVYISAALSIIATGCYAARTQFGQPHRLNADDVQVIIRSARMLATLVKDLGWIDRGQAFLLRHIVTSAGMCSVKIFLYNTGTCSLNQVPGDVVQGGVAQRGVNTLVNAVTDYLEEYRPAWMRVVSRQFLYAIEYWVESDPQRPQTATKAAAVRGPPHDTMKVAAVGILDDFCPPLGQNLAGGTRFDFHANMNTRDNLFSLNGRYRFTMQDDCNLVLYDVGKPLWQSGTAGQGSNCELMLDVDGELCIYDGFATYAKWSSGKFGARSNSYVLAVQNDCNVVIYGSYVVATTIHRFPLWATNADCKP